MALKCWYIHRNGLAWLNCAFFSLPPQFHPPGCSQLILGLSAADRTWDRSQGNDLARVMGTGQLSQAFRLLAGATCFCHPYAKSPVPLPDEFERRPRTQDGVSCGPDLFPPPRTISSLFRQQSSKKASERLQRRASGRPEDGKTKARLRRSEWPARIRIYSREPLLSRDIRGRDK